LHWEEKQQCLLKNGITKNNNMIVNNYDDNDITEGEDAFIKSMIDEYKQKLETATAAGNVKQAWKANMMILVLTQCRSRSSYQEIEDILRPMISLLSWQQDERPDITTTSCVQLHNVSPHVMKYNLR
jgi:hypothetical protein